MIEVLQQISTTRWRWVPFAAIICVLWISLASISPPQTRLQHLARLQSLIAKKNNHASQNRTLGFGEILISILPERVDQIDGASLVSLYGDIDLTIIDGVTSVAQKAIPPGAAAEQRLPAEIGCWRVHMNMIRHVVDHRLETALILEADADWDVRIKDQLQQLSANLPSATDEMPYGNDWTALWLGPCTHRPDMDHLGPVISYKDETVGKLESYRDDDSDGFYSWIEDDLKAYNASNYERIVHRAYSPYCTAAYAVTLEGARKILWRMGIHRLDGTIDGEYNEAINKHELPGIVVMPPLMSQWKIGDPSKDSDISNFQHVGHPSSGPHIVQSLRRTFEDHFYESGAAFDWLDRSPMEPKQGDDY